MNEDILIEWDEDEDDFYNDDDPSCDECGALLPLDWESSLCENCFIPTCDECGREIYDAEDVDPADVVYCRDCGYNFGKIEQLEQERDSRYYPEGMEDL